MTPRIEHVAKLFGSLPGGVACEDISERYTRDWSGDHSGSALALLRPRSTAEVQQIMRIATRERIAIVPQGGHTGLVGGATPSSGRNEVILSLERLNAVREVSPEDFYMVAEAGCILSNLQAAAADAGMFLPIALGAQESCQIGGNISTNAGGVNVLRYGMTGRMVLGLEAVMPDGSLISRLKGLRKDNTGYRLSQLLVGAEGTLGVVTAVSLELFPSPTQIETAFLALPSYDTVLKFYGIIRRKLGEFVSALEVMDRDSVTLGCPPDSGASAPLALNSPVFVLLEAATSADINLSDVMLGALQSCMENGLIDDAVIATNRTQRRQFWAVREQLVEEQVRRGRHLRTDVSVAISRIPAVVAEVRAQFARHQPRAQVLVYGHFGDGNLHINVLPPAEIAQGPDIGAWLHDCEALIFDTIDRHAGSISAEHGIGIKKRPAFLSRATADEVDIMRRIKAAIDPQNIMSPGRIFT